MALSTGPNITGPILEYSTYHYNYHTLQQLITYNDFVQAKISNLETGESQEKYPKHNS